MKLLKRFGACLLAASMLFQGGFSSGSAGITPIAAEYPDEPENYIQTYADDGNTDGFYNQNEDIHNWNPSISDHWIIDSDGNWHKVVVRTSGTNTTSDPQWSDPQDIYDGNLKIDSNTLTYVEFDWVLSDGSYSLELEVGDFIPVGIKKNTKYTYTMDCGDTYTVELVENNGKLYLQADFSNCEISGCTDKRVRMYYQGYLKIDEDEDSDGGNITVGDQDISYEKTRSEKGVSIRKSVTEGPDYRDGKIYATFEVYQFFDGKVENPTFVDNLPDGMTFVDGSLHVYLTSKGDQELETQNLSGTFSSKSIAFTINDKTVYRSGEIVRYTYEVEVNAETAKEIFKGKNLENTAEVQKDGEKLVESKANISGVKADINVTKTGQNINKETGVIEWEVTWQITGLENYFDTDDATDILNFLWQSYGSLSDSDRKQAVKNDLKEIFGLDDTFFDVVIGNNHSLDPNNPELTSKEFDIFELFFNNGNFNYDEINKVYRGIIRSYVKDGIPDDADIYMNSIRNNNKSSQDEAGFKRSMKKSVLNKDNNDELWWDIEVTIPGGDFQGLYIWDNGSVFKEGSYNQNKSDQYHMEPDWKNFYIDYVDENGQKQSFQLTENDFSVIEDQNDPGKYDFFFDKDFWDAHPQLAGKTIHIRYKADIWSETGKLDKLPDGWTFKNDAGTQWQHQDGDRNKDENSSDNKTIPERGITFKKQFTGLGDRWNEPFTFVIESDNLDLIGQTFDLEIYNESGVRTDLQKDAIVFEVNEDGTGAVARFTIRLNSYQILTDESDMRQSFKIRGLPDGDYVLKEENADRNGFELSTDFGNKEDGAFDFEQTLYPELEINNRYSEGPVLKEFIGNPDGKFSQKWKVTFRDPRIPLDRVNDFLKDPGLVADLTDILPVGTIYNRDADLVLNFVKEGETKNSAGWLAGDTNYDGANIQKVIDLFKEYLKVTETDDGTKLSIQFNTSGIDGQPNLPLWKTLEQLTLVDNDGVNHTGLDFLEHLAKDCKYYSIYLTLEYTTKVDPDSWNDLLGKANKANGGIDFEFENKIEKGGRINERVVGETSASTNTHVDQVRKTHIWDNIIDNDGNYTGNYKYSSIDPETIVNNGMGDFENVYFQIVINPEEIQWLLTPEGKLNVVDTMGSDLEIIPQTIQLADYVKSGKDDTNSEVVLLEDDEWDVFINEVDNVITFKVPDGKAIVISYWARIIPENKKDNRLLETKNTVSVSGMNGVESSTGSFAGAARHGSDGVATTGDFGFMVKKTSKKPNGKIDYPTGIRFELTEYVIEDGQLIPKVSESGNVIRRQGTISQGSIGVEFNSMGTGIPLTKGGIYLLTEIEAPSQYIKAKPIWIVFNGFDDAHKEDWIEEDVTALTVENLKQLIASDPELSDSTFQQINNRVSIPVNNPSSASSFTITATKRIDGRHWDNALDNGSYHFIFSTNDKDAPFPTRTEAESKGYDYSEEGEVRSITISNGTKSEASDGQHLVFPQITIGARQLPSNGAKKTFEYFIEELDESESENAVPDITYTHVKYKVVVTSYLKTITDPETNEKSVEVVVDSREYFRIENDSEGNTIETNVGADGISFLFENNYPSGDLIVSKQVAGSKADPNKKFNFKVVLDDSSINGVYGKMQFTNGVATFSLKDGESIRAEDLPVNLGYTVYELDSEGYEVNIYYKHTSKDGTVTEADDPIKQEYFEGSIKDGELDDVKFVNYKEVGSLKVTKTIEGVAAEKNRRFKFIIQFEGKEVPVYGVYQSNHPYSGPNWPINFVNGRGEFELGNGEYIIFDNLMAGLKYTITEMNDDGYVVSVRKGITTEEGTIFEESTNDDSIRGNGVSEAEVSVEGTVLPEQEIVESFKNSKEGNVGDLIIEKTFSGNKAPDNGYVQFILKILSDIESGPYQMLVHDYYGDKVETVNLTTGADAYIGFNAPASLSISGLPDGTEFSLREVQHPGSIEPQVIINGVIKADKTTSATIDSSKINKIEVENNYSEGVGEIEIKKTVRGNAADSKKDFNFEIVLLNENGDPATDIDGKYGDIDFELGVGSFTLSHNQVKKAKNIPTGYHYEIREILDEEDGYTSSVIEGESSGFIEEKTTLSVTFENFKEKKTGAIEIKKQVSGNAADPEKDFDFEILLFKEDRTPATDIDGKYGDILFKKGTGSFTLRHNESKEVTDIPIGYYYEIREILNPNDGYTSTVFKGESSGVIQENITLSVTFDNHKDKTEESFDRMPDTGGRQAVILFTIGIFVILIGLLLTFRKRSVK